MADVTTDEFLNLGRLDLSDDVSSLLDAESEVPALPEASESSSEDSESLVLSTESPEAIFLTSADLEESFGLFCIGMSLGILLSFIPFVIKTIVNGFKAWTSTF